MKFRLLSHHFIDDISVSPVPSICGVQIQFNYTDDEDVKYVVVELDEKQLKDLLEKIAATKKILKQICGYE